jgi:hypothetical protein
MAATVTARVRRGMKLLDEAKPGWERQIKLVDLSLDDANYCVLGQLYGTYDEGLERLGGILALPTYEAWAERGGFTLAEVEHEHIWDQADPEPLRERYWGRLTVAWKREIARRLGQVSPP